MNDLIPHSTIHDLVMLYLDKHPDICDLSPTELTAKYVSLYDEIKKIKDGDINKIIKERAESGKSIF